MSVLRKFLKTTLSVSVLLMAGSAVAETKTYDLAPFTGVKAATGVDVTITVGEVQSVRAVGPDGKMDRLEIAVDDGMLRIRRRNRKGWGWGWDDSNFEVTISVPELNVIDASSGAEVRATGVESERVTLDASSGADIDVSGSCDIVSADASSGADIDARDLVCREAIADVSSGADIDIHATERFTGEASSGGGISVYGKPTNVNAGESSGGDIDMRG